jgi:hypothetical protein
VSNELSNYCGADRQPRLDDPGSFRAPGLGINDHLACFTPKRSLVRTQYRPLPSSLESGAAISDWNRFAEVCQIWLGEFTAASLVRTGSGSALTGIATMAPLLRLGPSSTRLRWAADVLCEGIGEWADASGNEALRPFSSSSMRAVNASVTRLLDQPHAVADESTFSGIDVRLLTWLTAEPMRKGSADFEMPLAIH